MPHPKRIGRPTLRSSLVRRIGHRGTALLFFALLDAIYAYSLCFPPPSGQRTATMCYIASVAPLYIWGTAWAIAGLFCLFHAFRRRDEIGYTAAIIIKTVWGTLYISAGLIAHVERSYVGATIWLALAAFVGLISTWPEPGATRQPTFTELNLPPKPRPPPSE